MKTIFSLASTLLLTVPAWAQAPQTAPSSLPVRQVTLFTSGVSYTERGGSVDGDATVPLLFRTAQINDILKSLVLLDQTGQVQPATYAARNPLDHALQTFAVDVTHAISQDQILSQLRGANVTVETPGKPAVTGQIIGVEERRVGGEDSKPINAAFLNLFTDAGLVSLRLDGEHTIRLLDARLNKEFRDALTLLASGSDDSRRQVMLHFAGNGRREVRVGYVTEAPLWKMSYRLLLDGADAAKPIKLQKHVSLVETQLQGRPERAIPTKGQGAKAQPANPQAANAQAPNGQPYLQGWAIVENTSDEDWQNVRLSLVSGRPISFIQDLYQPLYLPRPVVGADVVASPYPQTHEGDLQNNFALGFGGLGAAEVAAGVALEVAQRMDGSAARQAKPVPPERPVPVDLRQALLCRTVAAT